MVISMAVMIGAAGASPFLIGLITCFATHDGIPAVARAAWRR
jgi:hypothetical protein